MTKPKNRRNMLAGPAYEREIVKDINGIGIFPEVDRSAKVNPEMDAKKVDIVPIQPDLFNEFVYKIQAKCTTKAVPYDKLLEGMEAVGGVPVILHKKTKRVENDRFLTQGKFAIVKESDFFDIIGKLEQYKKGYDELHQYWDSIDDDEKPELHERLKKLGL